MRRVLLALGICTAAAALGARAADIQSADLNRHDGWLSFGIHARELLDARTRSTVESGLPGSCVYRVELVDERGRTRAERLLDFSLRFDVWDEFYLLEGPDGSHRFDSLAAADSAMANPTGIPLVPLARLAPGHYRLRIEVAVRPIAAEDRLRLAEYVRRGNEGGSQELHFDVASLFARIAGGAGADRVVHETAPFEPAVLPERR